MQDTHNMLNPTKQIIQIQLNIIETFWNSIRIKKVAWRSIKIYLLSD